MLWTRQGPPGSGKTYGLTRTILEVVKAGRKVITNVPLKLEVWEKKFPDYVHLIEIREFDGKELSAWEDDWTGEQGEGPLFIIDEAADFCQKGMISDELMKHFRMHRHKGYDIIFGTQAETSLDPNLRKMFENVEECKNLQAIGLSNRWRVSKYLMTQGTRSRQAFETTTGKFRANIFELYESRTVSGATGGNAKRAGTRHLLLHPMLVFVYLIFGFLFYLIFFTDSTSAITGKKKVTEITNTTSIEEGSQPTAYKSSNYKLMGVSGGIIALKKGSAPIWWYELQGFKSLKGRCGIDYKDKDILCGEYITF
jgi:zona occludens toxin (predicted ATPase)